MAIIPNNLDPMNDIEIAFDASVSEQLFNKIGANINGLINLSGNFQIFTASDTWIVPEGIATVYIYGAGGGGGGGGGGETFAFVVEGGGGGQGVIPTFSYITGLTPFDAYTVTVGAGGGGGTGGLGSGNNGGTGGSSIFTGPADTVTYFGGLGGGGASNVITDPRVVRNDAEIAAGVIRSYGGDGGAPGAGETGQKSIYANGGVGGATQGGGGGGGGLGAGGNGGTTQVSGTAGAGFSSGGGGGGSHTNLAAGNGGAGGGGLLILTW